MDGSSFEIFTTSLWHIDAVGAVHPNMNTECAGKTVFMGRRDKPGDDEFAGCSMHFAAPG
jgi:hypothetical protein